MLSILVSSRAGLSHAPRWNKVTGSLPTWMKRLRQGGLGIGSTLGYMRAGVSSREVFELQRLAGMYGRFINIHFRLTPGDDVQEVMGIQEMLANAAALGSPAIAASFQQPRV